MFVLTNGWAVDHPRRQQGETVTYVRDALDRIIFISESTVAYAAYEYDDQDRHTRATLGNTRVENLILRAGL